MMEKEPEWTPWEIVYDKDGNPRHKVRHAKLSREEYARRLAGLRRAMNRLYEECLKKGIPWPGDDGKPVPPCTGTYCPYPDLIVVRPHQQKELQSGTEI